MSLHPPANPALRPADASSERHARGRDRASMPGWLIFLLLGLAVITAFRVLPGSGALVALSGTFIAP